MVEWFRRKSEKIKTLDKKDIAEGMWLKCPQCREVVYRKMLEENYYICINCTHHFRISSDDYIQLLFDEGEFEEIAADVESVDPLNLPASFARFFCSAISESKPSTSTVSPRSRAMSSVRSNGNP